MCRIETFSNRIVNFSRGLILLLAFCPGLLADPPQKAPPKALRSATKEPAPPANPDGVQFQDVTSKSGIHFRHERAASDQKLYLETMGAGVGWLDYDQDGFLDIFFVNSGVTPAFHPDTPPQPALYRNNGDGTFTDVTAKSGIHTDGGFFFGVAIADFDNDGYPDIYMTGYRHSILYHNNRDGTFTDVTTTAGVVDEGDWATAAGWFDYDHDGNLDLLVTNYVHYDVDHPVSCGGPKPGYRAYCHPDSFSGSSPRLYHNNGNGTFTDVTKSAGLVNRDGKSLAVVLADLNGDGWPDIFIANDTQRNFLYLNNGDGTFRDATYSGGAGFSEDGKAEAGMSADAADVRNNGYYDLFVSHLDFQLNRYYRNSGEANIHGRYRSLRNRPVQLSQQQFRRSFFRFRQRRLARPSGNQRTYSRQHFAVSPERDLSRGEAPVPQHRRRPFRRRLPPRNHRLPRAHRRSRLGRRRLRQRWLAGFRSQ